MAQTPKVLSQKRRGETLLCIIYHAKVNIAQGDVGILSRITNLSGNSSVTLTTAKILAWEFNGDDDVGMVEWLTKFGGMDNDMAEWRKAERHYGLEWLNGRMAEWRNGWRNCGPTGMATYLLHLWYTQTSTPALTPFNHL